MRSNSRDQHDWMRYMACLPIMLMLALMGWTTPALAESAGDVVVLNNEAPLTLECDNSDVGVLTQEGVPDPVDPVQKADIAAATITAEDLVYTGEELKANVTVVYEEETLVEDVDYTIAYVGDHTNAGTATIEIQGIGDRFEGTVQKTFTILSKQIVPQVTLATTNYVYDGSKKAPTVSVSDGDTALVKGADYKLAYESGRIAAGKYSITVTLRGNYSGTKSVSFTIARQPITKAKVTGIVGKTYNGKAQRQKLAVKLGAKTLKANRDYTVAYKRNVNAGAAKVVIRGAGNYNKSITKTFNIAKRDFSKAKVGGVGNQLYTGAAITPKPTVKWGKTALVLGRDYKLAYKNNKALGTATITVTGRGNYSSATKATTFKIYQVEAKKFSVSSIGTQYYSGSSITPSPVITWQGRQLQKGRDYTVSYKNNRYGGWATMTITGKGSFKGSKTVKFYIDGPEYVGTTVYITNTGEKYHNAGCRFLYSSHAVDLGEAEWLGYTPCSVCH